MMLGGSGMLVVAALALAGCGGGSSSTSSSSASGSAAGGSSGTSSGSAGSTSAGTSDGTPSITASNVKLPTGTPGKGKPSITIGDKNFPEEVLLGQLYQMALQAKGYTVNLKSNIGGSEIIDTAFKSGQIDMYPEYLGEIVSSIANKPSQKTDLATYNVAKQFESSSRSATLLKQTPFQDVDVLFVKSSFAKQHTLKSISDLVNIGPKGKGITYVAQPPTRSRYSGLVGLQQAYGLTAIKFLGAPAGQQYTAIDQGSGNVGDAFSTDPQFGAGVTAGKYVSLTDPKAIMGFQHVAPVVKSSVLAAQGPQFQVTLDWVSSLLTLKAIQAMNVAIQTNHQNSATVAAAFLKANGL